MILMFTVHTYILLLGHVHTKGSASFKADRQTDRCSRVDTANSVAEWRLRVAAVAQMFLFRYLRIMT